MNFPVIPLVVATALFMQNMDSTILATALPAIARDLAVEPLALKLAVTSYLVGLAVLLPISGWIADHLGPRLVFRAALVVFVLASIGCAEAHTLAGFVLFRFVQGMGGAMMVPVGRLVIIRTVPKAELLRAFAFLTMPALIGPTIGPPLGGAIVTYADWRWIFFINVPIGVLGIVLATLYMPDTRFEPTKLDATGLILLAIGLSGIVLGAAMTGRHVAPAIVSTTTLIVGAVGMAAYTGHALGCAHPVLDLRLFKIRSFQAGVVGGFLYRMGTGASTFLLPLMLQLGFGLSAMQSGMITFAGAVGAFTAKPLIRPVVGRFGFRRVLLINAIVSSLLIISFAMFTPATPHVLIFTVLLIAGMLRSLHFTSMASLSYADIDGKATGPATGLATVAQETSTSLGVAIGAQLLEFSSMMAGNERPLVSDYATAFTLVALISLTSVLNFVWLPANAGEAVSGHHEDNAPADPRASPGVAQRP